MNYLSCLWFEWKPNSFKTRIHVFVLSSYRLNKISPIVWNRTEDLENPLLYNSRPLRVSYGVKRNSSCRVGSDMYFYKLIGIMYFLDKLSITSSFLNERKVDRTWSGISVTFIFSSFLWHNSSWWITFSKSNNQLNLKFFLSFLKLFLFL